MVTTKTVATVWTAGLLALLSWSFVAAGINAGADDRYDDQVVAAQKQEQFYRVIAGESEGGSGVLNKLAQDLRDYGEAEKNLTKDQLVRALRQFRGDSNRYGGISEELGFDPFNGVNCSECGPLDEEVISRVVIVRKNGDVGLPIVLNEIKPSKPDHKDGTPTLLWLLWVASLPVGVLAFLIRQRETRKQRYGSYEQEMQLIDRLGHTMAALPEGGRDYEELSELRTRLKESIDARVGYRERARSRAQIEAVAQEARDSLDAIVAGNKALE